MNVEFYEASGEDADDIGRFYFADQDPTPIRAYHYPYCCTGLVLAHLGGSDNAFNNSNQSKEAVKYGIEAWIDVFTVGEHWEQRKQFISVCTTDQQKEANAALEELGFDRSPWVDNGKYGGRITTWMLPIGHLNKMHDRDEAEGDY